MTVVQMVTGCAHCASPVPIHLPLNRPFDTAAAFHMIAVFFLTPGSENIPQELLTRLWPAVSHEFVLLISLL